MSKNSEKTIFLEALELDDPESRANYIKESCGGDEALQKSVEELLSAHLEPDHMIDDPAVGPAYQANQEASSPSVSSAVTADLQGGATLAEVTSPAKESATVGAGSGGKSGSGERGGSEKNRIEDDDRDDVGRQIGAYKIMELIGEGGFGLVYVAQQSSPVRRRVALKILKPGMSSKEVLARFAAERQAVAMMDHPNIAQVFDAGVTDDGRPYFAMELVKGVPITEFCESYSLRLRERVELMKDVSLATHHAHQKGVIHRDLKPSNVLVTLHDDRPVAKIIDFGVAKAIGQNLAEQTIYTRFFSMIGTPLYMSPEQASMNALDVDTRSDVFSLGVLLYELLAGSTPFERQRLDSVGYDEMRRIIMEEEPPKPSTRLTTVIEADKQTVVDRTREMRAAPKWDPIPVDLDWIVMKAMEKDRNRRYESAAALASDLKSFLANEQVAARPPSTFYRLSKLVQRNRVALATSSLVALALLVGTVVSVYLALEAIDQREAKNAALQEALAARDEMASFTTRIKDANVAVERARVLEQSGQHADAYSAYTAAVEEVPAYYLVWMQRAVYLAQFGLFEEAASDYATSLSLDAPVNEYQWNGASALFLLTGRDADFRTLYEKMYRNLADDQDAASELSRWLAMRGCLVAPADSDQAIRLASLAEELLEETEGRNPPNFLDELFRSGIPNPWGPRGGPPGKGGGDNGSADAASSSPQSRRERSDSRDDSPSRPDKRPRYSQQRSRGWQDSGRSQQPGRFPGGPDGSRGGPGRGPGPTGPRVPDGVRYFTAAWAYQRAGQYELARTALQQARRDQGWKGNGVLDAVEALVLIDEGQGGKAEELLERSAASIVRQFERRGESPQGRHAWFDLIEHVFLHREALSKLAETQSDASSSLLVADALEDFQRQSRATIGL